MGGLHLNPKDSVPGNEPAQNGRLAGSEELLVILQGCELENTSPIG
jgi:hypothetical protein